MQSDASSNELKKKIYTQLQLIRNKLVKTASEQVLVEYKALPKEEQHRIYGSTKPERAMARQKAMERRYEQLLAEETEKSRERKRAWELSSDEEEEEEKPSPKRWQEPVDPGPPVLPKDEFGMPVNLTGYTVQIDYMGDRIIFGKPRCAMTVARTSC